MRLPRRGGTIHETSFDSDGALPRLSEQQLAALDAAGDRQQLVEGQVLFDSGELNCDFFVVLKGRVEIVNGFGTPTVS